MAGGAPAPAAAAAARRRRGRKAAAPRATPAAASAAAFALLEPLDVGRPRGDEVQRLPRARAQQVGLSPSRRCKRFYARVRGVRRLPSRARACQDDEQAKRRYGEHGLARARAVRLRRAQFGTRLSRRVQRAERLSKPRLRRACAWLILFASKPRRASLLQSPMDVLTVHK